MFKLFWRMDPLFYDIDFKLDRDYQFKYQHHRRLYVIKRYAVQC